MKITDRDITQEELNAIYADFAKIEIADGVPQRETVRHQFVLEEDGAIVGFVSGLTNHKWFYLTDLWVQETHRRRGIGSDLLARMEQKARSVGMEHIYTWTSGFSNPLFYEKQGYTQFAILENFFEIEGYHHMGYRKDL